VPGFAKRATAVPQTEMSTGIIVAMPLARLSMEPVAEGVARDVGAADKAFQNLRTAAAAAATVADPHTQSCIGVPCRYEAASSTGTVCTGMVCTGTLKMGP
jgi:hypothetical protein